MTSTKTDKLDDILHDNDCSAMNSTILTFYNQELVNGGQAVLEPWKVLIVQAHV